MDWHIEYRAGVHVVVFAGGGCRPASEAERQAWAHIQRLEWMLERAGFSSEQIAAGTPYVEVMGG